MLCLSSFTIGLRWNLNDSADQNVVCSLTLLCSEKKVLVLLFLQIYLFLLPTLCIVWVGGDQLPPSFILNFRHLPPRINPTSSQSTQNMPKYEFKARRWKWRIKSDVLTNIVWCATRNKSIKDSGGNSRAQTLWFPIYAGQHLLLLLLQIFQGSGKLKARGWTVPASSIYACNSLLLVRYLAEMNEVIRIRSLCKREPKV